MTPINALIFINVFLSVFIMYNFNYNLFLYNLVIMIKCDKGMIKIITKYFVLFTFWIENQLLFHNESIKYYDVRFEVVRFAMEENREI